MRYDGDSVSYRSLRLQESLIKARCPSGSFLPPAMASKVFNPLLSFTIFFFIAHGPHEPDSEFEIFVVHVFFSRHC